ncbi:hypothetical protein [Oleisolibacter albus]|uniref:hypothetical protein n=1 Tax=Oleisolibacter albus TaxID=2171757 RepID=UPI0012D8525A|nr:hypothetical protein [Oleisolibacter albus]
MPLPPADPVPFDFRWRTGDGRWTEITCWARTQTEAEAAARRGGWPGHDGTRLGRFRAWLRGAILDDQPPAASP